MPATCPEALLTLARFARLPEAEKTDAGAYKTEVKVVKTFHPMDRRMHNPTLPAARLYPYHPHWRAQDLLREDG